MKELIAPRAVVDRAYLDEALTLIGGAKSEIMAVQFELAAGATTARIEDALGDAVQRSVRRFAGPQLAWFIFAIVGDKRCATAF